MRHVDVVIVGGGFAGAAVAFHLAYLAPDATITVIEPRRQLGQGLAYASGDPSHRINVPADRMSLLPDDGEHFARWVSANAVVADDPEAIGRDGFVYPRRGAFGAYVASQLSPLVCSGRVSHVVQRASTLSRDGQRWRVGLAGGSALHADVVVIATTHPPNTVPQFATHLIDDDRVLRDPLAAPGLRHLSPDERLLIVGTGLTMADIVASLDAAGHRGSIAAVSRHGLLSRGHAGERLEPFGDFQSPIPTSAIDLLRRVRGTIADAEMQGVSWQAVLDAVRAHAQSFWPRLEIRHKRQIVRHLRVFWDVHRFRVAPQLEDVIVRKVANGSLTIAAASIVEVVKRGAGLHVTLRRRGRDARDSIDIDRMILATGPAHASVIAQQPYLQTLADDGVIQADSLGLGLLCDRSSRLLDRGGAPAPGLFVAGPLARATFGELMGLPQVSQHAADVAGAVFASLKMRAVEA